MRYFDYGSKELFCNTLTRGFVVSLRMKLVGSGAETHVRLDNGSKHIEHCKDSLGKKYLSDFMFLYECMISKTPIVILRRVFEDHRILIDFDVYEEFDD